MASTVQVGDRQNHEKSISIHLLKHRFLENVGTLLACTTFIPICTTVPELDRLKEQVAYLKFWQGIMVVTDISLVGWLVSTAGSAERVSVALGIVGVVALSAGIIVLHRQIERRIDQIGKL